MAARSFFRIFASLRRLILVLICFSIILLILRTPTAPYFSPGRERPPPPPPPASIDGNKFPRRRLPPELQDFLIWDPPQDQPEHYPSYDGYKDTDFDPNRWEGFPQYVFHRH